MVRIDCKQHLLVVVVSKIPECFSACLDPLPDAVILAVIRIAILIDLVQSREIPDTNDALTSRSEYNFIVFRVSPGHREKGPGVPSQSDVGLEISIVFLIGVIYILETPEFDCAILRDTG